MSNILGKIKRGAGEVAFEADKVIRINRVRGEVGQLKRQLDARHLMLGELVYRLHMNNERDSPEVDEVYQGITETMQAIGIKEEEIKRINSETYTPPEPPKPQVPVTPAIQQQIQPLAESSGTQQVAPSQVRYCTNCGQGLSAITRFCPECGTKME